MFPNRNEGTFGSSLVPNKGTRVHSDVPGYQNRNEGTFAKTGLLQNCPFVSSRAQSHSESNANLLM